MLTWGQERQLEGHLDSRYQLLGVQGLLDVEVEGVGLAGVVRPEALVVAAAVALGSLLV